MTIWRGNTSIFFNGFSLWMNNYRPQLTSNDNISTKYSLNQPLLKIIFLNNLLLLFFKYNIRHSENITVKKKQSLII